MVKRPSFNDTEPNMVWPTTTKNKIKLNIDAIMIQIIPKNAYSLFPVITKSRKTIKPAIKEIIASCIAILF